ncbi:unnamed protein product [Sphagnum balticum]
MACNAPCLYATQHGSRIEMRDCATKNNNKPTKMGKPRWFALAESVEVVSNGCPSLTIKSHLMQYGRHLLYQVWKGPRDLNSFDEEWASTTRASTLEEQGLAIRTSTSQAMGGLLDENIDVANLLANGFVRWTQLHPLQGVEKEPNIKPLATSGPTNPYIVEEVQRACEMVEVVANTVEVGLKRNTTC